MLGIICYKRVCESLICYPLNCCGREGCFAALPPATVSKTAKDDRAELLQEYFSEHSIPIAEMMATVLDTPIDCHSYFPEWE